MGTKALEEKVMELQRWALPASPLWVKRTDFKLYGHFQVTELLFRRTSYQHTLVSWKEGVKSVSYWVLGWTVNYKEVLYSSRFFNSSKNILINSKSGSRLFHQVSIFERLFTMVGRVLTHSTFIHFYNLYCRVSLVNEWNLSWSSWDELIPLKFWEHWSSLYNRVHLLNGHKRNTYYTSLTNNSLTVKSKEGKIIVDEIWSTRDESYFSYWS